ncbi:hypothetical protein JCM5353_001286 [Sporobolomyces roseus]
MSTLLPSSSRIDYLSRLPNELLTQIFEDVYVNWNEGVEAGIKLRKLIKPISKRFLEFQRQGLYREIKVTRWTGARSFTSLLRTVVKEPSLGSLITSLHLDMSVSRYSQTTGFSAETKPSSDDIKRFFKALVSLQRLKLAGRTSEQDSSILAIYSPYDAPLLVLSSIMENFDITTVADEWRIRNTATYAVIATPPPAGILPSTRISLLSIEPYDPADHWYTWQTGKLRTGLNSIFLNLENLNLRDSTSEYSASLLDVLPRTGISKISLVVKDVLPISSLISLVSTPTTLRSLVLSFDRETGEIGTRVSTVDFDGTFRGIDLETEDIAQDAMPDDWTYPQLPAECSIEDLLLLREKAREAGVELAADKLYEAVEIQQAVDEDLELLDELWQKWKRNQKKVKKSGKARKSKK